MRCREVEYALRRSHVPKMQVRILATVEKHEPIHGNDIGIEAPINNRDLFYLLRELRHLGCLSRVSNRYRLTERGRVALAIWRGKQEHGRSANRHGERLQAGVPRDGAIQRRAA